jgi:hypothetical protein
MDLVGNLLAPTLIQADVNFREGPAAAVGRTKEEIMSVRLIAAIAAVCLATSGAFAQNAGKPTDPQIAHIAYTAGQIDIEAAEQALNKSQNKDVREFATDMERDHIRQ